LKNKGLTSLAEKGLVRTVPDAFKAGRYIPSVSLIHNLRIDGVIGGVTKYVKGKVLDTGNLFIKSSTNITKSEANIAEKIINSSKNNAIRTSEAVVEKVVNKSSERVTKDILEQAINLGTKAEKKVLQKSISKATETAILKTAEKTSVKIASNLVKTLPYVTAAGEAYIMFKDIQVAKDVCTDSNASNLSKFLAGSTVALDGISIASHVSGMGIKVGIIASGASIVTSLATHVTR